MTDIAGTTEIVAAVDGSGPGQAAVRWAARAAHRSGSRLRIVHAYDWNWAAARFGGAVQLRAPAVAEAERILGAARQAANEVAPGIPVSLDAVAGSAVAALLGEESALRIVVGHRGSGGFDRLVLGSVGRQVVMHSHRPVVVVRGHAERADGPVVVGADGSPAGVHAVEEAFAEAAARHTTLVAIRAYPVPVPPWGADVSPLVYDPQRLEAAERAALHEDLAPGRDKYPQVAVEALVVRDDAAAVLTGVSGAAQLLVVGHRGHGTLAGALLGSVALKLVHHADCPVLIARP
ncbi:MULTISPECIES: universal stress protein [Catenuloplanes]|uniref:Nucleotide-binding universal stress UspA family protein n=1 Tax=Catenuloplanes niger TaxID=587534 RepID=A0AAE4CX06_9ACTN|nr:universal stress protein [Catenuloplanes niger]MDR7327745.1 nucleotide-binding universal stress UspA family protein [Catenuloplanes niger]